MARILVCDGDGSERKRVRSMLDGHGHEVHEAADGPAAIRLVEAIEPVIVVLDANLPKADGHEVLARLQERSDRERFAVILLTEDVTETEIHRSFKLGMDAFLEKPFDPSDLRQLVEDISWRKRRTQRASIHQAEIGEFQPRPLS